MSDLQQISYFIGRFQQATMIDQLRDILEELTANLGFRHFAMGHHVDLTRIPANAVSLTNYERGWTELAVEHEYFAEDPIHAASLRTQIGFLWSDVGDMIPLTIRQRKILALASKFALGQGFTVPAHVPGEYSGTCSFGAPNLERLKPFALHFAQLGGTFAFEAARRIIRKRHRLDLKGPPFLTSRQQQALVLLGRGKTDREIASILGIAPTTAHEHVESVRRAYGNAQRAFLIVRALFDGQISFADLLRR